MHGTQELPETTPEQISVKDRLLQQQRYNRQTFILSVVPGGIPPADMISIGAVRQLLEQIHLS